MGRLRGVGSRQDNTTGVGKSEVEIIVLSQGSTQPILEGLKQEQLKWQRVLVVMMAKILQLLPSKFASATRNL